MEINITKLVRNSDPMDYSASISELGSDAWSITWNNAQADSDLIENIPREVLEKFIMSVGDAVRSEVSGYTDEMVRAWVLQYISGDMREAGMPSNPDADWWKEYEQGCRAGIYPSSFFLGDDEQIYFSLDT